MFTTNLCEFLIIRISYDPNAGQDLPQKAVFKKPFKPWEMVSVIQDWYRRVYASETFGLPVNSDVFFTEWRVDTSRVEYFKVYDYYYEKVVVLLGRNTNHWIFYDREKIQGRRRKVLSGTGDLLSSYCACCLHLHYSKLLQKIHDWFEENKTLKKRMLKNHA